MFKIDRAFLKLLFPIWFSFFVLIIVSSIIFKQSKTPFYITIQETLVVDTYRDLARNVYLSFGKKGLIQWLKNLESEKKIRFYLFSEKSKSLMDTNHQSRPSTGTLSIEGVKLDASYLDGPYIISPSLSHDESLRLVAHRDTLYSQHIKKIPILGVRIFIGLILSLILCYAITRIIYRKIRVIRRSIREIKKGNFRSIEKSKNKQDELSLLFNEVFEMSITIEQLIQSKNRLLQDISHEFRSPLARQLTAIAIAKRKCMSLERSHLERIEEENIKLEQLVSELLEYSKTNRNKELILEPIQLNALLAEVVKKTNFEFQTNAIVQKDCQPISLDGDPGLLYRAFENIIRNAVKYSGKEKEICVLLSQSNKHIVIQIKDKGPGVSKEELELMFHPFHRLESKQKNKQKGYGLGLAIAKEIIEMHQGKIHASLRKNGGLSVTIELLIKN